MPGTQTANCSLISTLWEIKKKPRMLFPDSPISTIPAAVEREPGVSLIIDDVADALL